ncbi:HGxxPAAW family protein [Streptosporangium sp. NPDC002524]|uniref:HGxxPAAW family protein n=1 Tax=Streptosporangium sp. NPDC002524 TaxID=3154537 RepID=UPI00331DB45B
MGIGKDLAELAEIHEEHDMGHTVAGWTGSIVCITGFAISGVAMVVASVPFFWIGAGVVALGGALGWLLHRLGLGKEIGPRPASERGMRLRPAPRTPKATGVAELREEAARSRTEREPHLPAGTAQPVTALQPVTTARISSGTRSGL